MPAPTPSTATAFFKASLEQHAFSHGYVLYGKSIQTQYNLAMFMAQVLNCEALDAKEQFHPCGECRACKWIQTNAHPSVITLSPLTYPDAANEGKPRKSTLISVGQVRRLIAQISQHGRTGEERVIIFTNAERFESASETPSNEHPTNNYPAPSEWLQEKDDLRWKPLTRATFSAQSANAFLKYLEEPTSGIRYFFLTQQPETLLPTVVSRCQKLYVPPDELTHDSQAERIPYEAALIQWIQKAIGTEAQGLPAHPATQAFIQLAEDEHVKPMRLFEDVPYILSRHRALLFGDDYSLYLAWQAETKKALTAMTHYVQPANALWHMLHKLCEVTRV